LSSLVMRIPDESIVEVPRDAGIGAVLAAMQASAGGDVVVTEHGRPYGLARARLVSAAAGRL
jgi:hypothetical protein